MFTADDFQYALENTQVLLGPKRKIATFGSTQFRFHLITESMDCANEIRIREGSIQADRPMLLTPEHHAKIVLENFGEKAAAFAEWLRAQGGQLGSVVKYGFQFRRSQLAERVAHDTIDAVGERLCAQVSASQRDEPLSAVIRGVDDAWEVCLLKFTMDLVKGSGPGDIGELRRHGLL